MGKGQVEPDIAGTWASEEHKRQSVSNKCLLLSSHASLCLIHFYICSLSAFYELGTLLGSEDTEMKKTRTLPLRSLHSGEVAK